MYTFKKMKEILYRLIYLSFFSFLFFGIFIYPEFNQQNWISKFSFFNVPNNSYPGGDARNIQKAAHCKNLGFDYYNNENCNENESFLRKKYKGFMNIPKYNYPPILADVYGFWNNNTENFFLMFWRLNAVILMLGYLIISFLTNYKVFPLLLFSPITLLAIERGNVDCLAFSLVFIPLVIVKSKYIQSIFIVLSGVIKIYPFFGLIFIFKENLKSKIKFFLVLLFMSPLILYSLMHIDKFVENTTYGFEYAFGLSSLKNSDFIKDNNLHWLIILVYIALTTIFIHKILNSKVINQFYKNISSLPKNKNNLLFISLVIYVFVFMLSTSWAYRFIFLIPAFLVLIKFSDTLSKVISSLILLILWVPIFSKGWILFNILNYLLFPFTLAILLLMTNFFSMVRAIREGITFLLLVRITQRFSQRFNKDSNL